VSPHGSPATKKSKHSTPGLNVAISAVSGIPIASRTLATAPAQYNVDGIHLPGEETDEVPIYDTCDRVREKILPLLDPSTNGGMAKAVVLRLFNSSFVATERRLQPAQLNRFMSAQGVMAGSSSSVFYAAYVYFEKLRVRDGVPKTAERQEIEAVHPYGINESDYGRIRSQRMRKPKVEGELEPVGRPGSAGVRLV